MVNSFTEVEQGQSGGLPQLDVTTYEEQVAWLFLTFLFFYVVVSRFALPKVSSVLENREELVASDLDIAGIKKQEAEEVKAAYEASLEEARAEAQNKALEVREASAAKIAAVTSELDAKLSAEAAEAEANIAEVVAKAMKELDGVASEVASELILKVSGSEADSKAVSGAVKSTLDAMKGA